MTNELAIKTLHRCQYGTTYPLYEALDMAIEALGGNGVAQERKYTFGNDEFSLEAAYHDCKLVFDGITDDNSFQEADTGLILYYANEIIYALHEALSCSEKPNMSDTIYRQDAIDVAKQHWYKPDIAKALEELPSAQPEQRWIPCEERLPEKPKENPIFENKPLDIYLVCKKGCVPFRAFWNGKNFADGWTTLDVDAWMPLPEAYKGDTNGH